MLHACASGRGCYRALQEGIKSRVDKHVRFHQEQPGQQERVPAHPPEGSSYDWRPRQITNFQTTLLCQCLLAKHTIHLEHQVPRDCRHQQKAHLDSKPLPFCLEGFQEDNSRIRGRLGKGVERSAGTVIRAKLTFSTDVSKGGLVKC